MELRKIQWFLRIVETGSLTKAAASLYTTQPTLSRFLANLEAEAGTQLFHREKDSSLRLTEFGRTYLETAKKIDALWEEMHTQLPAYKSSTREKRHILVGIDEDNLHAFASVCADKVTEQYPDVSIQVLGYGALEIQQLVAEGRLDIGLTAYAEKDERLTYYCTSRTEINLVASHRNSLAAYSYKNPGQTHTRLSLHDLPENTSFALMRNGTVLREAEERYMQTVGYTPNVKRTYIRHGSVASLISDSDSLVGFCPCDNLSDRLAYIALDTPFFYTRGVCYRRQEEQSLAQKLLISLLKKRPSVRFLD